MSAQHDLNAYLRIVKIDGAMVLVGAPPQAAPLNAFSLIGGRKTLAGSLIGGIRGDAGGARLLRGAKWARTSR